MIDRYNTLKGLIISKGFSQTNVAKGIGMDRTTFNIKINRTNGRDFTLNEAILISRFIEEPIDKFF